MEKTKNWITLDFERERPARWAVHTVVQLMQDEPEGSLLSVRRQKREVTVLVSDAFPERISIFKGDSFFLRLSFAYALRYPHIVFWTSTRYLESGIDDYWEYTNTLYENGVLTVTQHRHDPDDAYGGEYVFRREACWKPEGEAFVLLEDA